MSTTPIKFTFNVILPPVFTFDVGPNFQQNLTQLGAKIVGLFDDLTAEFNARIDDLKATGAAEHDQVASAIQSLQDQLNQALAAATTPDQLAAFRANMNTGFDAVKGVIGGVFEPAGPPTPSPDEPPPAPPAS